MEKKNSKTAAAKKPQIAKKPEDAKTAPKAEKKEQGLKGKERKSQIVAEIKKGADTLAKLLAISTLSKISVNYYLHPMLKTGEVQREKVGHGFIYKVK